MLNEIYMELHVLADEVKQIASDRFVFTLTQSMRRMTLICPCQPIQIIEHRHSPTLGLTLVYPEQSLTHQLRIGKKTL